MRAPDRTGTAAVLAGSLLTLLTILRCPGSLLTPQFYAEDGPFFFAGAHEDGFLATFLQPSAGYLNALPRLLAGIALLAPLEWAPFAMVAGALAVQMLPVCYLLSRRAASFLPGAGSRVLAALLYAAAPNAREIYLNGTNSQWHLTPAVLVMLLSTPPARRAARLLDLFLLAVFTLTGPSVLILLPLLPWYLKRSAALGRGRWGGTVATILLCGAAVQAGFLAASARLGGGAGLATGKVTMGQLAGIISTHALYDVVLGEQRLTHMHFSAELPLQLLGLALLLVLAGAVVRLRSVPLLALGYLAASTVALSLFFPTNDLVNWLQPGYGQRYYFFATLFVVYAVAHLCGHRGAWRALGLALAAPLAFLGFPSDFYRVPWADTKYADQIAQFKTLPAGESYYFPTVPQGWGMRLRREPGARPGEAPLARLRAIPRETVVELGPFEVDAAQGLFTIKGRALDAATRKPAGGVYLFIDGRLYPASYGQVKTFSGLASPDADFVFRRPVPLSELGPGPHRMTIIVLTRDRTAYYQPRRAAVFTVPEQQRPADPPGARQSGRG